MAFKSTQRSNVPLSREMRDRQLKFVRKNGEMKVK